MGLTYIFTEKSSKGVFYLDLIYDKQENKIFPCLYKPTDDTQYDFEDMDIVDLEELIEYLESIKKKMKLDESITKE